MDYPFDRARRSGSFRGSQEYWRGRIWGPMNYLVLPWVAPIMTTRTSRVSSRRNPTTSFSGNGKRMAHALMNYNAMTGVGDDVRSSDRFYHWGALLGYIQYLQRLRLSLPSNLCVALAYSATAMAPPGPDKLFWPTFRRSRNSYGRLSWGCKRQTTRRSSASRLWNWSLVWIHS